MSSNSWAYTRRGQTIAAQQHRSTWARSCRSPRTVHVSGRVASVSRHSVSPMCDTLCDTCAICLVFLLVHRSITQCYKGLICSTEVRWRRRRDSNPRDDSSPTPLAGERLRPLGHVSAIGSILRDMGKQEQNPCRSIPSVFFEAMAP